MILKIKSGRLKSSTIEIPTHHNREEFKSNLINKNRDIIYLFKEERTFLGCLEARVFVFLALGRLYTFC